MGETRAQVEVLAGDKIIKRMRALVDSGSTLSIFPGKVLAAAGVRPERKHTFVLSNGGKIRREIGNAVYRVHNIRIASPVVFGLGGDRTVVGLVSLEAAGLGIDTIRRRLIRLRSMHQ